MADIGAVLRKTIDGLPRNSPQIRAKVYEKARAAIERQIGTANPPMSPVLAATRRADIEDAISTTEDHYLSIGSAQTDLAGPIATSVRGEATPAKPGSKAPAPVMRRTPPPAIRTEPVFDGFADDEPMPAIVSGRRDDEPLPIFSTPSVAAAESAQRPKAAPAQAAERARPAHVATDPDPAAPSARPPTQRPARDRTIEVAPGMGFDQPSPTLNRPRPKKTQPEATTTVQASASAVEPGPAKPRTEPAPEPAVSKIEAGVPAASTRPAFRRARTLAAAVVGTLATAATVAAILVHSPDGSTPTDVGTSVVAEIPPTDTPTPAPTSSIPTTAWDDGRSGGADGSATSVEEGSYVPPAPATKSTPPDQPPAVAATTPPVATATPETTPTGTARPATPEQPSQIPATTAPASAETAASVPGTPAPTAPRSVFYEEKTLTLPGTMLAGETEWSVIEQAPEEGQPPEPAIRAVVRIPDRGTILTLTIGRNADPALPASHLIEMMFQTPEGTVVQEARQLFLKPSEKEKGEPLVGISGKVSDGYFILALNDLDRARQQNESLLRSMQWIDVPLLYASGRRALFSLEKGPSGDEAFAEVFDAWSRIPAR